MSFKLRKPNPKGEFRISLGSIKGYKSDSPDRDNDVNVIHSSTITMEGVPHDVQGKDNTGISIVMEPGKDYEFPGDVVVETPFKKAPPGKEHVVKALKGKVDNPYAVAWAQYNKEHGNR